MPSDLEYCPQCGGDLERHEEWRTGKRWQQCRRCGAKLYETGEKVVQ